jgi:hypothetical protein
VPIRAVRQRILVVVNGALASIDEKILTEHEKTRAELTNFVADAEVFSDLFNASCEDGAVPRRDKRSEAGDDRSIQSITRSALPLEQRYEHPAAGQYASLTRLHSARDPLAVLEQHTHFLLRLQLSGLKGSSVPSKVTSWSCVCWQLACCGRCSRA